MDRTNLPFFRKLDWSAFWTTTIIAFAVYFYTMAPGVTMEDSGELATASAHLGVPHPPGYPIWTIVTWIFTKIFAFVPFRGQPNPAWAVVLVSVVFGALTSGITAILICRSATEMVRSIRRTTEVLGQKVEDAVCWTGGVSGSLIFAFSPVNWSQAVIVEVYSMGAFFLVMVLFLTYTWIKQPRERLYGVTGSMAALGLISYVIMLCLTGWHIVHFSKDFFTVGIHYVCGMLLGLVAISALFYAWKKNLDHRLLYLTAFVFGLGMTNYQVILLILPALALAIFLKDPKMFRDFLVAGVPYLVISYLVVTDMTFSLGGGIEIPPRFVHPSGGANYFYMVLNVLWLAFVYFKIPNGRAVAPTILAMELGLAVYIFMPLASETNPPMNWAYPRTWEGFIHAITRGQYEKIVPSSPFTMQFVHQIGDYLSDLRGTFTLPIAILGFIPFTAWNMRVGQRRIRALYVSIALAVTAVVFVMIEEVMAPKLGTIAVLSGIYRTCFAAILLLAVFGGIIMLYHEIIEMGALLFTRKPRGTAGPDNAALFETDIDADSRKWAFVTLVSFMAMSLVLVMLASPKGDIQDFFIQRVKFISSHGLFAFWIGYGLVFGLSFADTLFRGNRLIVWAGIFVALLLPLVPLHENNSNRELVRVSGGAEENGHDFGWQFGNYQLRGAEAVIEELGPEEEPIPNPVFPPEMGTNAVFFGGTDPGRFVPTYMIYSAHVRSDVFLITQNALADDTYMSVMRDLYGDDIWIPAVEDSALAFQRYVEEVRSGKRPPNAELNIEGGRVQVSGALGVMEINGILAQMIFEHNNYRHDFYVEESYVIQWMYPYLEAHGLIMKINAQPNPMTDEQAKNDLDFWDWYTRRLTGNEKFLRDVVARKSFSKLRSALGGLYAFNSRFAQAERAFNESRLLYPLSPEANFRLVQEVLIRQGLVTKARETMKDFGRQDPGNDRVGEYVKYLERTEQTMRRVTELEAMQQQSKLDINTILELAECYLQTGQSAKLKETASQLLSVTNFPPQVYFRLAAVLQGAKMQDEMVRAIDLCLPQIPASSPPETYLQLANWLAQANRIEKMLPVLQKYLQVAPQDWKAWVDMGYLYLVQHQPQQAIQALNQARYYGGPEAENLISQDQRFSMLRSQMSLDVPRAGLLGLPRNGGR